MAKGLFLKICVIVSGGGEGGSSEVHAGRAGGSFNFHRAPCEIMFACKKQKRFYVIFFLEQFRQWNYI